MLALMQQGSEFRFENNFVHSCGWFGLWIFERWTPKEAVEGNACGGTVPKAAYINGLTTWNCEKGESIIWESTCFLEKYENALEKVFIMTATLLSTCRNNVFYNTPNKTFFSLFCYLFIGAEAVFTGPVHFKDCTFVNNEKAGLEWKLISYQNMYMTLIRTILDSLEMIPWLPHMLVCGILLLANLQ